jgi:hypothetical protein
MSRIIIALSLLLIAGPPAVYCHSVFEAQLAGSWYPSDPEKLRAEIKGYIDKADISPIRGKIIALISPHAGIFYSGGTAAYGFKAARSQRVDTVVVVGFSHRMGYDGIAVFDKDAFRTPLGDLDTDKQLLKEVTSGRKKIFPDAGPFSGENSVELILPFIQVAFGRPKVLLLAIGAQSLQNCEILGEALYEALQQKDNFLIIASTDLSHYLPQRQAEKIDADTARLITDMQPRELFSKCKGKNRMCGPAAVASTMIAAKKLGADTVYLLDQSTSAKASLDTSRVVGYLSAVLVKIDAKKSKEGMPMKELLNPGQKKELLGLARDTITLYLKEAKTLPAETDDAALRKTMGVFVTLRKGGQLRGCIGNIIGTKPLYLGVRDMAIAAATQDPRFPPLKADELKNIHIEISVLSPLQKITDPAKISLGVHGVLVKDGFRSGVYLPQVATETGWDKDEFMSSLCAHKAGLPADCWKKGECEIFIFTAEVFEE